MVELQLSDEPRGVVLPRVYDLGVTASKKGGGAVELNATDQTNELLVRVQQPQVNVGAMVDSVLQLSLVFLATMAFIWLFGRIRHARKRPQREGSLYCPRCNYEVGWFPQCAECGMTWRTRRPVKGRSENARVRKLAIVAGLLLMLAMLAMVFDPGTGKGVLARLGVLSTKAVPVAEFFGSPALLNRWMHPRDRTELHRVYLETGKSTSVRLPELDYFGGGYATRDGSRWICWVPDSKSDASSIALVDPRRPILIRMVGQNEFFSTEPMTDSLRRDSVERVPLELVYKTVFENRRPGGSFWPFKPIPGEPRENVNVHADHVDSHGVHWIVRDSADGEHIHVRRHRGDGTWELVRSVVCKELPEVIRSSVALRPLGLQEGSVHSLAVSGDGEWIVLQMWGSDSREKFVRLPLRKKVEAASVTIVERPYGAREITALSQDGRYGFVRLGGFIDVVDFSSGETVLRCDARISNWAGIVDVVVAPDNTYVAVVTSMSGRGGHPVSVLAVFWLPSWMHQE